MPPCDVVTLVCDRCGGPVCTDGRATLPLLCLDPQCRPEPPRVRLTRRDTDPQKEPAHATG